MLTGVLAARNIAGERHDVWAVNVDEEYHESTAGGDRLTPEAARHRTLEQVLVDAFALYDPVAMGAAVGIVAGAGLFLATAVALLHQPGDPGRVLSLLGQYLIGYRVSWLGAGLGLLGAGTGGFLFGAGMAGAINRLIMWNEALLRRQIEEVGVDPLEAVPQ